MGKQYDVWGITRARSGVIVPVFTLEICFNFGGVIDTMKDRCGSVWPLSHAASQRLANPLNLIRILCKTKGPTGISMMQDDIKIGKKHRFGGAFQEILVRQTGKC